VEVRSAIEVQNGVIDPNACLPPEERIPRRTGPVF
jgi:hypothetical protein